MLEKRLVGMLRCVFIPFLHMRNARLMMLLSQLKIEDPPAVDNDPSEDEISEPDEDTLAGQMAAMRGDKVKKRVESDDSDESGTDDDEESESDSSSDSDSD